MAIKVVSASEVWDKDVFTDKGLYCGKVEDIECDLKRFRVRSLIVKSVKGSYVSELLGKKKGIIIPYSLVTSIGDVIIIKHISVPEEAKEEPAPTQ